MRVPRLLQFLARAHISKRDQKENNRCSNENQIQHDVVFMSEARPSGMAILAARALAYARASDTSSVKVVAKLHQKIMIASRRILISDRVARVAGDF